MFWAFEGQQLAVWKVCPRGLKTTRLAVFAAALSSQVLGDSLSASFAFLRPLTHLHTHTCPHCFLSTCCQAKPL